MTSGSAEVAPAGILVVDWLLRAVAAGRRAGRLRAAQQHHVLHTAGSRVQERAAFLPLMLLLCCRRMKRMKEEKKKEEGEEETGARRTAEEMNTLFVVVDKQQQWTSNEEAAPPPLAPSPVMKWRGAALLGVVDDSFFGCRCC